MSKALHNKVLCAFILWTLLLQFGCVCCVILAHWCIALTHWLVLAARKIVGTDRTSLSTFCVWRRITDLQSVSHIAVLVDGFPFVTSQSHTHRQFHLNPFPRSQCISKTWYHWIIKQVKQAEWMHFFCLRWDKVSVMVLIRSRQVPSCTQAKEGPYTV